MLTKDEALSAFRSWAYFMANEALRRNPAARRDLDADDVAQEALIAISKAYDTYDESKGAFPSYVTKAARWRIDELVFRGSPPTGNLSSRGTWTAKVVGSLDELPGWLYEPTYEPDFLYGVTRSEIVSALRELPEDERVAVVASTMYELAPADVMRLHSGWAGKTDGVLRHARTRGINRLRLGFSANF